MIHKPNKPPHIENLCRISLTCYSKLIEHIYCINVSRRISRTTAGFIPGTMLVYEQHLSTEDILFLLTDNVVNHGDRTYKSSTSKAPLNNQTRQDPKESAKYQL